MRCSLSMLAALSACISAATALPQPGIVPRAGQRKPHYSVVPLEPGDGAPGQGRRASSDPVTVVKTVVEKQSPVTRVIVETAHAQTVTRLVPPPTPTTEGTTTMGLVTPGASSSAAIAEPPASSVAAAPSASTSAPTHAPSAAAASSPCPEATHSLATRDGTRSTSALAMAPTTLSTVATTLQPWLPSPPPTPWSSAVPKWDKQVPAAYPGWNGTAAYRYHRS